MEVNKEQKQIVHMLKGTGYQLEPSSIKGVLMMRSLEGKLLYINKDGETFLPKWLQE